MTVMCVLCKHESHAMNCKLKHCTGWICRKCGVELGQLWAIQRDGLDYSDDCPTTIAGFTVTSTTMLMGQE